MEGEDFDWKPPSEAEMKVLQARRERSDKISKLMGDYLLKGYRMLGSCCAVCGTILLRDRQQQDYCVCCTELETDLAKDDPAVSATAARSQLEEHELSVSAANHNGPSSKASSHSNGDGPQVTPSGKRARHATHSSPKSTGVPHGRGKEGSTRARHQYENQPCCTAGHAPPLHPARDYAPKKVLDLPPGSPDIVPDSMQAVMGKMYWACQQLKGTSSVEGSTQLCVLIKACADAMTSLRYLVPGELTD